MDLNFLTIALLNIYLALFLYLFNLLVTASLLNQKPNRRKAFLWVFPYMLLIVPLPSLFFLMDMFHSLFISLTEIYLETGAWALAVKGIYRIPWKHTFATAGLSNFLSRAVSSLNGIFLSRNYDLTVPKDLAAYLFTESIGILLPALFILWIIRRYISTVIIPANRDIWLPRLPFTNTMNWGRGQICIQRQRYFTASSHRTSRSQILNFHAKRRSSRLIPDCSFMRKK